MAKSVKLTYKITLTREESPETPRTVTYEREFTDITESWTTTIAIPDVGFDDGKTISLDHMDSPYATVVLYNRDTVNTVKARMTRTYRRTTWKAGDLIMTATGAPVYPVAQFALPQNETRRLGDFRQQGWESGMRMRLRGTRANDGSYGVGAFAVRSGIEDHQMNLFRNDTFPIPFVSVKDHEMFQENTVEIDLANGLPVVVDNVQTQGNLTIQSDVGGGDAPIVDIIVFY